MTKTFSTPLSAVALMLAATALSACELRRTDQRTPGDAGFAHPEQAAFWTNLRRHCEQAYEGRLVLEPPGDEMLTGEERLIAHFRECGDSVLRIPFHIEKPDEGDWDRSRTWIITRDAEGLELRHDHRHRDGSPDEQTMYGGRTDSPGSPQRQEFILAERRAPDGSPLGWRLEVDPGRRYTYGTIRGGEWTWRVDFSLDRATDVPPAPWGAD